MILYLVIHKWSDSVARKENKRQKKYAKGHVLEN